MNKYYLALGRFIQTYSMSETGLFLYLVVLSGMPFGTGQALLSGTRVKGAIDFIRRIHESRLKEVPNRLQAALSHLSTITTVRDHLLHSGVAIKGPDDLISTNWMRAHAEKSRKEVRVSADMLAALTHDLETIIPLLEIHSILHVMPTNFDSPDAQVSKQWTDSLRPWLYRPS